jgi:sialic acid synthase SpsE
MDTLRKAFGLRVGYSDHTLGISVSLAAVARGATVIEKHFTLDCTLPGPDHKASLQPDELAALIRGIREVEAALGENRKAPTSAELKNRPIARRSLIAICAIGKGERFTKGNLGVMRPGDGLSPMLYWDILGREAKRGYTSGERIEL